MLNWNDLRYFLALSSTGSVAGAARQLGVNQSTVFRRLQALEQQVGLRLFIRKRDGYQLTAEGQGVRESLGGIEAGMQAAERRISQLNTRRESIVRIATFAAFAEDLLPCILNDLESGYPDFVFEIHSGRAASDLLERHIDFAVRSCPEPPGYLIGKRLMRLGWSYYSAPEYLRAHGCEQMDLQEDRWYQPFRFLSYHNEQHLSAYHWHYQRVPPTQHRPGADSLEGMAALCRAGLGVALLCDGIRTQGLIKLAPLPAEVFSDFWLLYHPDLRIDRAMVALAERLAEQIRSCESLRSEAREVF